MSGISYYNNNRDMLFEQYHAYDPLTVHRAWRTKHLNGTTPGLACDIGAGTGRDANWLAQQGWQVLAVEPSKLRELGQSRTHSAVVWIDDSLPELENLRTLGMHFDLILLRSVWMHVPRSEQEWAFRNLANLLNPAGLLVISLRHGSDQQENRARGFHEIDGDRLLEYADSHAIALLGRYRHSDRSRRHIQWEWLVFKRLLGTLGRISK